MGNFSIYRNTNYKSPAFPFSSLIKRESGQGATELARWFYFGTASTPETFGAILKRWTGSVWTKAKLMVYNGSWISKPLKVFKEGTWQNVDTL
jgi:hypothetical protein